MANGAHVLRPPRKKRSDAGIARGVRTNAADPGSAMPSRERLNQTPQKEKRKVGRMHACTPASQEGAGFDKRDSRGSHQLSLSERVAAGRTPQRLKHLEKLHMFSEPTPFNEAVQPSPGVAAKLGAKHVLVVSVYRKQGVPMADVLHLHLSLIHI